MAKVHWSFGHSEYNGVRVLVIVCLSGCLYKIVLSCICVESVCCMLVFFCNFRWFHGKIDRTKADELLNPRTDGLFLVRESKNFPGDYTLSVCCGNKVEHYRIIYSSNKLTIDEEGYFDNLTELVEVLGKFSVNVCFTIVC